MKKELDEVLQFLYDNSADINAKALIFLLKCYEPYGSLSVSSKEYIADNLFSNAERNKYYSNGSSHYFYETLKRRT